MSRRHRKNTGPAAGAEEEEEQEREEVAESQFGAYGASNSQKQPQSKKKNQAQQEPQSEPSRPQVDSDFGASGAEGGGTKVICTHYARGVFPIWGGALIEEAT